ncbi:MAG: tRNA uridine-5-carboxymethylaminomethyl(34) synthesis GTPase MnmE [Dysgonamonadaceae bacterium]|jgi:tRNA modification GTPase|nr:tRNA uridine-5-carboxymethylaminomethyl(34) synthesis GTPase MnmE [Dysgonamonadaceae bacterium]
MDKDTICAVSTPPGQGGIAVVRVSGTSAIPVCDAVFVAANKEKLANQQPYTIHLGKIYRGNEVLDEVLASVFRSPHSYTGEDIVELACHGSAYIQQELLKLLVDQGCRLATAGEFTLRAFLNNKMDLSQAEAVADLITSSSEASHRLAVNQMRGGFSRKLQELRAQLLNFLALLELELDFSEENVAFADRKQLSLLAKDIRKVVSRLINSFSLGNAIKNGIPVVIVGETNAGKSTLLNHLLNEDRAIVSDIHGTTRDAIEDVVNIHGIVFRFIDTAGLRETDDELEIIGIERTYEKIEQASIVIWMIDSTQFTEKIDKIAEQIVSRTKDKKLIIVFNKVDKINTEEQSVLEEEFLPDVKTTRIYLSAKFKQNTEKLEKALLDAANLPKMKENDVVVTNLRHYEALKLALEAIDRVIAGLKRGLSNDLLCRDIRDCNLHLASILGGEITNDEVLKTIFERFCIGK